MHTKEESVFTLYLNIFSLPEKEHQHQLHGEPLLKLPRSCMLKLRCQGVNPVPTQHQWEKFHLIHQFTTQCFSGQFQNNCRKKKRGGEGIFINKLHIDN